MQNIRIYVRSYIHYIQYIICMHIYAIAHILFYYDMYLAVSENVFVTDTFESSVLPGYMLIVIISFYIIANSEH